jgi:hypothetical protein
MYTDDEILALEGAYDLLEEPTRASVIAFARAVERGDRAPYELKIDPLLELCDAGSGWGTGATWSSYISGVLPHNPIAGARVAQTIPAGSAPIRIPVSTVLEFGHHYGFILGGNFRVYSRQAAEGVRPRLVDQQGNVYPCLADITVYSSTAQSPGQNTYLECSGSARTYIRFQVPQDISGLTMELFPTKALAAQTITVSQLIPPINWNPARTQNIYHDSDLYFRSESIGGGDSPEEKNLQWQMTHPTNWKQAQWLSDGTGTFAHGIWNPTKRSIGFDLPIFHPETMAEARTAVWQMDFRIAPNLVPATVEAGKWAGWASSGANINVLPPAVWPNAPRNRFGELLAGNGGGNVHGDDGWSARGGFKPIRTAGHPMRNHLALHTYSYHLWRQVGNTKVLYHEAYRRYEEALGLRGKGYTVQGSLAPYLLPGEVLSSSLARTGNELHWGEYPALLVPGEWHTITQVMHINTPGEGDGYIKAYIDGKQVGDINGVCWRLPGPYRVANSTLGIARMWVNVYHGGIQMPVADTWVDLRRLAVKVLEWDQ